MPAEKSGKPDNDMFVDLVNAGPEHQDVDAGNRAGTYLRALAVIGSRETQDQEERNEHTAANILLAVVSCLGELSQLLHHRLNRKGDESGWRTNLNHLASDLCRDSPPF